MSFKPNRHPTVPGPLLPTPWPHAVVMASPDGLRLYFGRRAPPEVLDVIFEFGFNLWLGQRHDITRWEPHANDDGTGRVVYMTTALLVREEQLSTYALRLVWANYRKTLGALAAALLWTELV